MRVLQIATSYPADEADATAPFIQSIARALASDGHQLEIVVPSRNGRALITKEHNITVNWVPYAPTPSLNVIGHGRSLQNDTRLRRSTFIALPMFLAAAYAKASAIARNWKPDIVQSHWALPSGLVGAIVARSAGVPHIVSLHGSDMYVAHSRRAFRYVARWIFRNSRHVTACSPRLAEQAIRLGADPMRVHFMPYGVDPELFHAREHNLAPNPVLIVLAAGRLVEKKGFRLLVEYADPFLAMHPNAELWIAGDGDDRPALETAIAAKSANVATRIKLLGRVARSRMPELIRQAAVFVMPSVQDSHGNEDGLPNVILEAMSSGVTVVASDVGGASAIMEDGVTGIIVPAGDGPRLSRVIGKLLMSSDTRDRIGANAAELVRSRHTWTVVARRLGQMFEE